MSGFVLPFKSNIVYINIYSGSYFGEIDFVVPAKTHGISIEQMIDSINQQNFNLVRQFTVQALEDCIFLTIDIKNLQRMLKQFNAQFKKLFKGADKSFKHAVD